MVPKHSMGEPRMPAMTWLRPARRAPGCSWVALVGSETTQAVSVSPSQYSKRPSWSARSSRFRGIG